jgi:hypothetical protein
MLRSEKRPQGPGVKLGVSLCTLLLEIKGSAIHQSNVMRRGMHGQNQEKFLSKKFQEESTPEIL